jgi:hypothetical protein
MGKGSFLNKYHFETKLWFLSSRNLNETEKQLLGPEMVLRLRREEEKFLFVRRLEKELQMQLSRFVPAGNTIDSVSNDIRKGAVHGCLAGMFTSPGEFWVHPLQFNRELEEMMDKMQ